MDEVLVTVWCTTYNHAPYVRDALEGFLSQKTNFRYEVVIHDDASTDGTEEILREYEEKYPDIFRVFYEEENQYSQGKHRQVVESIVRNEFRGKYVAICEGDDFWIDSHKLQIQAGYLENHPECVLVANNSLRVNNITHKIETLNEYGEDKDITPGEVIEFRQACFRFSSVMVRKEMLYYANSFPNCNLGDWPLYLYAITKGKIHYFERIMSVCNWLQEGSRSLRIQDDLEHLEAFLEVIHFLQMANEYTCHKYEKEIQRRIYAFCIIEWGAIAKINQVDISEYLHDLSRRRKDKYSSCIDYVEELNTRFNREIHEFCVKYKHIVIMGAGEFASHMCSIFIKEDIDFEGFAISNNQHTNGTYQGKKVWKLAELPFELSSLGVVIGIDQQSVREEILKSLDENGIKNFCWPLLIR